MVRSSHGTGRDADDRARGYPQGSGFIAGAFVVKRPVSPHRCPRKRVQAFPRKIDHARDKRPFKGFCGEMAAGSGLR